MAFLIPDQDKTQRADLVWCIPVEKVKWMKWFGLAKKFKLSAQGVKYMTRIHAKATTNIVLLPTGEQTDDDVMTAAAWLRMVKQINCPMHVVRCTEHPLSGAAMISRVAGGDPKQILTVDDEQGLKGSK